MLLLVCVMAMTCGMTTQAVEPQKGSVEITLTDGEEGTRKENVTFEFAKVADLIDGEYHLFQEYEKTNVNLNHIEYSSELNEAAQKLDKLVTAKDDVKTDAEGKALINDLDVGVYLLRVSDKARYENVYPVLISIPTWNEEEGNMNYDITVIPKHSSDKVVTADNHLYGEYIVLFVISFILLVVLTCHNHFKCGKIAGNYSEKGGYTHGNDNDTKDPCCTRRIRPRGGRSID